jgi:MoaA/NifB/PqqE/SkfB family radical SAM enzyme
MYKVEVELTTNCQASCPMCARNINGGLPNPHLRSTEWSYEEFVQVFTTEFLKNISVITFCGVFGDPLICKDIKLIANYLREQNKKLIIHTNGSIRTTEWWSDFVSVMPTTHRIIFGVDGLADTHGYYRVGTDFDKICNNIKAFVDAGGIAQVQFLEFDHNKHQYEKLHKLFTDMNVHFFRQHTNRFRNRFHNVVDKKGTILYHLKPTTKSDIESFKDSDMPLAVTASVGKSVCCASLGSNSVYIDSEKRIWPCCETASIEYTAIRLNEPEFNKILPTLKKQTKQIQKELGTISVLEKPALEILSDDYWKIWNRHWHSNTSLLCKLVCGKTLNIN